MRRMTWRFVAILALMTAVVAGTADADSITDPDTIGVFGHTSLVLDASGNPVISYGGNSDLRVLHCDDPDCAPFESPIVPDLPGVVGQYTSIALDSSGNPVVSYYDASNGDLKILHCDDPLCAIGGDSITSPDTGGVGGNDVGLYTSLVLDSSGYPVVSYYDATDDDLKVMHCNDVNCAGSNESIETVDSTGVVGTYTSIELDALGYPVVSYTQLSGGELKLMHCNDVNCTGGNESISMVDDDGVTGWYTSLELDAAGNPVIAYFRVTGQDVKVVHCNDPNCTGSDESITSPDTASNVGSHMSLTLDSAGFPALAYYESANDDLKVMRCNDPNCAGNDEAIAIADAVGNVGQYASIMLDANGYPVVSYYDATNANLKVLHCDDPECGPPTCNGMMPTVYIADGDMPTAGNDVILGTPVADTIDGLGGNDTICSLGGDDMVFGGDGDDRIELGSGNDTALGQADNDVILGGPGQDMISGNAGNDTLSGEASNDTIFGGSGLDTINGGENDDTLGGGGDADSVSGDNGNDVISSGSGNDTLASGGMGDDKVNGGGDNDNNVRGNEGNDQVSGNGGQDVVDGDDGDDTVRGGQNDDLVRGGDGDDFVAGNEGDDICDGGDNTAVGDDAAPNCETVLNVP